MDKDDHHNFSPVLLISYPLPALHLSGTWNKKFQQYIFRHYHITTSPINSYISASHNSFSVHFTVGFLHIQAFYHCVPFLCFNDAIFLTSTLFGTFPFIYFTSLSTFFRYLLISRIFTRPLHTSNHNTQDLQGLTENVTEWLHCCLY